jgi:hypothetical protein
VPPLTLGWSHADGDDCLRVEGFADAALGRLACAGADELGRMLPVYPRERVDGPPTSELRARFPATRGRYVVDGRSVCFVPRFPFRPGTTYVVLVAPELVPSGERGRVDPDGFVEMAIECPARTGGTPARVVAVQPTAHTLPRNHLRFYVSFSDSMSEGEASEHVHLRRADTGEELEDVFLAFDPELWDPSRTRLTVLLDPARIKRGLAPHREVGYPLVEGVDVELVVDGGFRDARGTPLGVAFVQHYRVGPDLRSIVEPSTWTIDVPPAGSREPLVVHFGRPLDAALTARCLVVVDRTGSPPRGAAVIGAEERSWSFRPATAWEAHEHELVVDPVIEDVSGNSIARVFDRDLTDPAHASRAVERVRLPFVPA